MNIDHPINPFVSERVRRYVNHLGIDVRHTETPFNAALLFADISGFSKLASSFSSLGGEGAERLTTIVNGYFELLVGVLNSHGCDIVAFAGDAVFATIQDQDLRTAAHRAANCALEITKNLANYVVDQDIRLSIRVSVGAGQLLGVVVGEDFEKQMVLVGPALQQVRAADKVTSPGETALSSEVIELLQDRVAVDSGNGPRRLRKLNQEVEVQSLARNEVLEPVVPELRKFVPLSVLSRIDVGQTDWLAELRRTSIAFVRFDQLLSDSIECAATLNCVAGRTQKIVRKYDGTVIHFLADDKGTIAVLGFGIPPNNTENLAESAVSASQNLLKEFSADGIKCSVGVATGDVFCGPLGSSSRRCFTVLGDVVNLAARLMQSSLSEVLCDQQTRNECHQISFIRTPNHRIKGYDNPVAVFHAQSNTISPPLVGRDDELQILQQFADHAPDVPRVLIVVGEPGMGKSELIAQLIKSSISQGKIAVEGAASRVERGTPFFIIRNVISRLYRLQSSGDPNWRREDSVLELVSGLPNESRSLLPLLNAIFDTDFPEDDFVRQLTGERRVENLQRLVTLIVQKSIDNQRIHTVVLDDIQWMDEASCQLIGALLVNLTNVNWLLVTREIDESFTPSLRSILAFPKAKPIRLRPLNRDEILLLVKQSIGEFEIDNALIEHLWTRCGGNPFFAKELTSFLIDANLLVVETGVCTLLQPENDQINIPNSIKDVVAGRLAQLAQPIQLTAKVASVIGQNFNFNEIDAVYPVPEYRVELPNYVMNLCEHNIIAALRKQAAPELEHIAKRASSEELREFATPFAKFCFRHSITQKVAYSQLPVAQRRQLHQSLAVWQNSQAKDGRNKAMIGFHFENAERFSDAAQAYADAGQFALLQGAGFDAIEFLNKALVCRVRAASSNVKTADIKVSQKSEASPDYLSTPDNWEAYYRRLLGEAYMQAGEVEESRTQLELSLKMFGYASPKERWRDGVAVLYLLLEQVFKRTTHSRPSEHVLDDEPKVGDVRHCVASANQRLAQIHYFRNDLIPGTARALRGLRIAQSIDDSPGLARSFADMCIVHSLLRFPKAADFYAIKAEQVARRVNHLPSLAYVLTVTNMHRLGNCRWDDTQRLGTESVQIGQKLQCFKDRTESVAVLAMLHAFRGEFTEGLDWFQQLRKLAEQGKNDLHRAWACCGLGEIYARTGRFDQAECELHEALELLNGSSSNTEILRAKGLLAFTLWNMDRTDDAKALAIETSLQMPSSPTVSALEGINGIAEVLRESMFAAPHDALIQKSFWKVMKEFKRYSKTFPVGRPRYHRALGNWYLAQDKTTAAKRQWKYGINWANKIELPYERTLIEVSQRSRG